MSKRFKKSITNTTCCHGHGLGAPVVSKGNLLGKRTWFLEPLKKGNLPKEGLDKGQPLQHGTLG